MLTDKDNPSEYINAAATDVWPRFLKRWAELGQVPPSEDPKVIANRKKVWELNNGAARISADDGRTHDARC